MHGLLDEDHLPPAGETRQQVLRALVDEVPTEMGEDNQD
jgi:hypothetical protein